MKYFVAFLVFISAATSHADRAIDAAGRVVLVGILGGAAAHSASRSLRQFELEDWQNSETGLTSELASSCGVVLEGRLIGDNRNNYLLLGLSNSESNQKVIKPEDITFAFEGGRERRPRLPMISSLEMKPNWYYLMVLPFPSKEDFKDKSKLTITVPIKGDKSCDASLEMVRNPSAPDRIVTYTTWKAIDSSMGLGVTQLSGGLEKLVNSSTPGTVDFNLSFWGPTWGLMMGVDIFSDMSLASDVTTRENLPGRNLRLSIYNIDLLHRTRLGSNQEFIWRAGYTMAEANLAIDEHDSSAVKTSTDGFNAAVTWQKNYDTYYGAWSWGFTLAGNYLNPRTTPNGTEIKGYSTTGLIFGSFGY